MTSEKMTELSNKLISKVASENTVSLLDYFAAREPTFPPPDFMAAEFPPNKVRQANGQPAPQPAPEAPALAAALAKWRFMVAVEMVKESEKRSE